MYITAAGPPSVLEGLNITYCLISSHAAPDPRRPGQRNYRLLV